MAPAEPSGRHATGPPPVAAVVVTWRSADVLAGCLDAVPPGVDVVVVDNGSGDGTVALARSRPGVRVVENRTNRGLAAANNQGLLATSAPFVLLANPDTRLHPGALVALLAAAQRHPRAALVVPAVVGADGRRQTSAGDLPTLRETLLGRTALRRRAARAAGSTVVTPAGGARGTWWDAWAHDEEREVGRGLECCYLVRREAVVEVGGQDERYVLDWEGQDWTARLRAAGWQVWFTPTATVTHLGGASVRQAERRWVVSSHRGMYRYFADRAPAAARPALAGAFAARGALKYAAVLVGSRQYARGTGEGER